MEQEKQQGVRVSGKGQKLSQGPDTMVMGAHLGASLGVKDENSMTVLKDKDRCTPRRRDMSAGHVPQMSGDFLSVPKTDLLMLLLVRHSSTLFHVCAQPSPLPAPPELAFSLLPEGK